MSNDQNKQKTLDGVEVQRIVRLTSGHSTACICKECYREVDARPNDAEKEIERLRGIVLACHRAFQGGSPFVQQEARRLAAAEVAEMDRRAKENSKQNDQADARHE